VHHQGRLRAGAPDVPLAAAEHLMDASPILITGMPGGHLAKSFGNAKTSPAVLGYNRHAERAVAQLCKDTMSFFERLHDKQEENIPWQCGLLIRAFTPRPAWP
jgi:hypothetical protein